MSISASAVDLVAVRQLQLDPKANSITVEEHHLRRLRKTASPYWCCSRTIEGIGPTSLGDANGGPCAGEANEQAAPGYDAEASTGETWGS